MEDLQMDTSDEGEASLINPKMNTARTNNDKVIVDNNISDNDDNDFHFVKRNDDDDDDQVGEQVEEQVEELDDGEQDDEDDVDDGVDRSTLEDVIPMDSIRQGATQAWSHLTWGWNQAREVSSKTLEQIREDERVKSLAEKTGQSLQSAREATKPAIQKMQESLEPAVGKLSEQYKANVEPAAQRAKTNLYDAASAAKPRLEEGWKQAQTVTSSWFDSILGGSHGTQNANEYPSGDIGEFEDNADSSLQGPKSD